jgi:protein tyrosine phosphatase (PTP) superfamily phosphohydrolase (DUF442 family)
MHQAQVDDEITTAGPDSSDAAHCPACGGKVVKRRRRMDGVIYFYRHKHGEAGLPPVVSARLTVRRERMDLSTITNYLPISDTLGTAGQPTAYQFAAIRAAGYEVVINLALSTSTNALLNEGDLVAAQGMAYVHIPVVWESPTATDLERFFAAMAQHRGRKVFVHCALNMRVSCFVFLYRVLRLGVPAETAWLDVLAIWEPDEVWQRFVDEMWDLLRRNHHCWS